MSKTKKDRGRREQMRQRERERSGANKSIGFPLVDDLEMSVGFEDFDEDDDYDFEGDDLREFARGRMMRAN